MPKELSSGLTLVTVVYRSEVNKLRLQARSLAIFAQNINIDSIFICINDKDEYYTSRIISDIKHEYGSLVNKVRIIGGEEIFENEIGADHGIIYNARSLFYSHLVGNLRNRGGWRGHDGWNMQQALKIRISDLASSRYIVLLDAKNFFVAPLKYSDFIAADGRPLARFESKGIYFERWYRASAKLLGIKSRPEEVTSFVTPFVVETLLLSRLIERLEARSWPVASVFARPWNRATEFMLINAVIESDNQSGIRDYFSGELFRSYTVFAGHPADLALRILREAIEENAKCVGIHGLSNETIAGEHLAALRELVLRNGLFRSHSELENYMN